MKSLISLLLSCSLVCLLGQGISKNTMMLSGSCGYGVSQVRDTMGIYRAIAIQETRNARFGLGLTYMIKERLGLTIGYGILSTLQKAKLETENKQKTISVGAVYFFKLRPKIYLGVRPQASYIMLRQATKSRSTLDQNTTKSTTLRIGEIALNLRVYWLFHRRWALSAEQRMGSISHSYQVYDGDPTYSSELRSWSAELLPSFQIGQLIFSLNYLINNKAGKAEQAPTQP